MTKFPPRLQSNDPALNLETGVCDCGHPDYHHNIIEIELIDIHCKWNNYTDCKDCMCPHFSLQHVMTQGKYLDSLKGFSK